MSPSLYFQYALHQGSSYTHFLFDEFQDSFLFIDRCSIHPAHNSHRFLTTISTNDLYPLLSWISRRSLLCVCLSAVALDRPVGRSLTIFFGHGLCILLIGFLFLLTARESGDSGYSTIRRYRGKGLLGVIIGQERKVSTVGSMRSGSCRDKVSTSKSTGSLLPKHPAEKHAKILQQKPWHYHDAVPIEGER